MLRSHYCNHETQHIIDEIVRLAIQKDMNGIVDLINSHSDKKQNKFMSSLKQDEYRNSLEREALYRLAMRGEDDAVKFMLDELHAHPKYAVEGYARKGEIAKAEKLIATVQRRKLDSGLFCQHFLVQGLAYAGLSNEVLQRIAADKNGRPYALAGFAEGGHYAEINKLYDSKSGMDHCYISEGYRNGLLDTTKEDMLKILVNTDDEELRRMLLWDGPYASESKELCAEAITIREEIERDRKGEQKIISKFGVWHSQINQFIKTMSVLARVEQSELEDWILSKGIIIFQNLRAGYSKTSRYKDADVNINFVTPDILLGETVLAFEVLFNACYQSFTNSKEQLSELRNAMLHAEDDAVIQLTEAACFRAKFDDFINVQSDITNSLIAEQNRKPSMDRNEIYEFVVSRFKLVVKNTTKQDLINMINDHLVLMDEFRQYTQKSIENPSLQSGSMFKPARGN